MIRWTAIKDDKVTMTVVFMQFCQQEIQRGGRSFKQLNIVTATMPQRACDFPTRIIPKRGGEDSFQLCARRWPLHDASIDQSFEIHGIFPRRLRAKLRP